MDEELSEEEVAKIFGQYQLTLNGLLNPLRLYGQGAYVDMVSKELIVLAWQLHWKLEGLDIPYEVSEMHW